MGILSSVYNTLKSSITERVQASHLSDGYNFEYRGSGASAVVVVLSGYKQPLWPWVFERLVAAVPEGADVCIMSAGKFEAELDEIAEKNNWSYLATKTNDVSLVQNVAIKLHPEAKQIIKVDEDVFLNPESLSRTLEYHLALKDDGVVDPGITVPMLNINGVCYRQMLDRLGLLGEYEERFGVAKGSTLGIPATDSGEAAKWIWEKTTPLLETQEKLAAKADDKIWMAGFQFSIGVMVWDRDFWEEIGYLPVKRHSHWLKQSTLGYDEEFICRMAMFYSRPIVICQTAFAGHFSFGRQYADMLEFLKQTPEAFD